MGKHDKADYIERKRSPLRVIFKIILILLLIIVLALAGLLAYLTITEYQPGDVTALEVAGDSTKTAKKKTDINVMTWNIGYAALGDNADFFMDGGSGVFTADEERLNINMEGIRNEITEKDPDILFLQEIDEDSARSHHMNELANLRDYMNGYNSVFAYNYKVKYVPYPIPPMGKVTSGISTFSRYQLDSAERHQLPCPFSWPIRTANLKRSLLISRTSVADSANELVLINLHLEAYDKGEGKIAQTKMLVDLLHEELEKGNYVIAGGDFNQIFSTEDADSYPLQEGKWHPGIIDVSEAGGSFNFLMDEKVPSCRSLDQPYEGADKDTFQYYLIDGFIVSQNIKIKKYETVNAGFKYSDHNPVTMTIRLN